MICDNLSVSKEGHLLFAGQDTVELAKKYGTPVYLMDEDKIREKCRAYKNAFMKYFDDRAIPLYASKANSFKRIYEIMTEEGIYAARDMYGRTPVMIGKKEDGYCVSFENFAYLKLGFTDEKELGPGEIVSLTCAGIKRLKAPGSEMRICSFLWGLEFLLLREKRICH